MRSAVGLEDGLGLDGDRCIRVISQQEPLTANTTTDYQRVTLGDEQAMFM